MNAARLPLAVALLVLALPVAAKEPVAARLDTGLPVPLRGVGIDQRLGEPLPLDLRFADEQAREVRLGDYFHEGRPVVLALAYYRCPMLCNQVLHALATTLAAQRFDAGKEFEVVVVSFDPRDGPEQAAARKRSVLEGYRRPSAEGGWHFLTGSKAAIESLTRSVGFRYEYDAKLDQFAHASGIMIATPDGRLARYFYGITYEPRDVPLGLVEASDNRIGNPVDQLLLYCYRYDPMTGQYGAVVMNLVRIGALLFVAGLVLLIVLLKRHEGKRGRTASASGAA